jgi:single-strand DNA-binding protein
MLNHISIMGRITKDIELRRTPAGVPVASFTVAVDRDFKAGGEKETDFIECVAWRGTAEFVERNFSKGKMIIVAGRLQIRKWEDKNGNKRNTAEIVAESVYFGDSKSSTGDKYEAAKNSELDHDYPAIYGDDSQLPF